jgi:hypothetical protein
MHSRIRIATVDSKELVSIHSSEVLVGMVMYITIPTGHYGMDEKLSRLDKFHSERISQFKFRYSGGCTSRLTTELLQPILA